jgi:hypothetical protein
MFSMTYPRAIGSAIEACLQLAGPRGRPSFLKKRSKKLLILSASAFPDRASSKSSKFFASFFVAAQVGARKALSPAFRGRGLGEGAVPDKTKWLRQATPHPTLLP